MRGGIKVLSGLITLATALALNPTHVYAFSGSGAGTSGNPYKIASCAQLLEIELNMAAHYQLAGSVDCASTSFHSIGDSSTPFTGTFDGKGAAIKNVSLSEPATTDVGIFSSLSNATVTDVRLDNISVTGKKDVGALAGLTYYATLSYISGKSVTVTGSDQYVGGLVGQLGGSSIEKSFVEDVDVTSTSNTVGGLIGYAVGPTTVYDSYAMGSVDAPSIVGGVIGQLGAGPAIGQRLYADVSFVDAGSNAIDTLGSGASASSNFMASAPYLSTSSVSPLDSWNFTSIWYMRPGTYPGLRPHTLPILLCNAPSSNASSITASCTSEPLLEGDPHWELRYGYHDNSTRVALATHAGQSFNVTVPGLLPGTDYDVEFRYVDAIGTSQWGKVIATTTGSSDVDNDGVSNENEFLAPNGGDGDDDGTLDYLQANATSFRSFISGKYVTLRTACTDNFNVQIGRESSTNKDTLYNYPAGLLGFVIRGCSVGATTPVEIYYFGDYNPSSYAVRKRVNGSYASVRGVTLSTATIGATSALKLSYDITDGGTLDDDGIADGNIVDPIGLAFEQDTNVGAPNSGVPRTGESSLIFLIGALTIGSIVVFGIRQPRKSGTSQANL